MKRDKIKPTCTLLSKTSYPTSDDWHPNFERDTVEIKLYLYHNPDRVGGMSHELIRIVVRGADDTCMARNEKVAVKDQPERLKQIQHWIDCDLPNPLTMEWLTTQGFQHE